VDFRVPGYARAAPVPCDSTVVTTAITKKRGSDYRVDAMFFASLCQGVLCRGKLFRRCPDDSIIVVRREGALGKDRDVHSLFRKSGQTVTDAGTVFGDPIT